MDIKVDLQRIIIALVEFAGYLVAFFLVAYKLGKTITHMESKINNTSDKLDDYIKVAERAFDKIDKAFDRIWDDRINRGRKE